ncbi:hypothetical protein EJB05_16842, partial [Eragrostis curvula]
MTQTPVPAATSAPAPGPAPKPAAEPEPGLPDAIAAALPLDPYEQLEVARKITAVAVAARASRLELEAARLRQRLAERDRLAAELADRAAKLEQALRDADARLRAALEDNAKLMEERDSLAHTSKKLARDLAKLQTFRRHLMQSLDDNNPIQETVDIRTCEQSVAKASSWTDGLANSHPVSSLANGSSDAESINQEVMRPFEQKLTITHITPRLASDPARKLRTAATSPRRYSTAVSPKLTSRATSPRLEGHLAMSPWLPSSKMSSAANSPPRSRGHSVSGSVSQASHRSALLQVPGGAKPLTLFLTFPQGIPVPGRASRVDGKEFFRQARSRLSYEQFAAFLANIKELNSHRQSQEETLRKADVIFGAENKDLFMSFQGLLTRSRS